ncbi:EFR1 family ferrodoxin [Eubacteriaceae bacterium ES3]|nr:EFR1 family ferrodoxin [Eubacteriaceae bacterium ES3]
MIFYFSGTGNSLHLAKVLAEKTGENLVNIAQTIDEGMLEFELEENERIGFVFPVYAWAPPEIVLDFIRHLSLMGEVGYVFAVINCGGSEGKTTSILKKALEKKGMELNSSFTLQMPSNYIIGSDVESQEEASKKLQAAAQKLIEIGEVVKNYKKGFFHTLPGNMPGMKSKLAGSMFNQFARSTGKFYANDECNQCGLCVKICPLHTISLEDKPVWGKDCTMCLACINRCPKKAIQYGKNTEKRGRYSHPDLK